MRILFGLPVSGFPLIMALISLLRTEKSPPPDPWICDNPSSWRQAPKTLTTVRHGVEPSISSERVWPALRHRFVFPAGQPQESRAIRSRAACCSFGNQSDIRRMRSLPIERIAGRTPFTNTGSPASHENRFIVVPGPHHRLGFGLGPPLPGRGRSRKSVLSSVLDSIRRPANDAILLKKGGRVPLLLLNVLPNFASLSHHSLCPLLFTGRRQWLVALEEAETNHPAAVVSLNLTDSLSMSTRAGRTGSATGVFPHQDVAGVKQVLELGERPQGAPVGC